MTGTADVVDRLGKPIAIGGTVEVVALDSGRGAHLWMTQAPGTVVGFGNTRVNVHFVSDIRSHHAIGPECLRVVEA